MLTLSAKDIYGNIISLPDPVYLSVNQEEGVPADDLTVTFPFINGLAELSHIKLKNNNQVVFSGIVDEQQIVADEESAYTKIIARSMAAVLLDNESKPINYTNPSASVIFSKHLKPLGFTSYKGENKTYYGTLNIPKGSTEWQAFYSFSINAFGRIPRIEADGTANFRGIENREVILFSNKSGLKYNSIKENTKRCQLISEVRVKATENGGYTTEFFSNDVVKRQIRRTRYMDASTGAKSINTAKKILRNSIDSSYEMIIVCPGGMLDIIGAKASVEDRIIGKIEKLYVSSVHYKLSSSGEFTTVKLKKEC